jgi:hemolysin activation/secretion protein
VSLRVPTEPTLALRLGGKKVWGEGEIPFQEAAYIGGGSTLRGFGSFRFAGDASLYGNANLRFSLANFKILFPTEFGVLALADAGRVWVDRESPDGWHTAVGGGVWFAPMRRAYTISLTYAGSTEGNALYVSAGFLF